MDSFHRADWLSLLQSIAALSAVIGAFGVVFLQHSLASKQAEREKSERTATAVAAFRSVAVRIDDVIRTVMTNLDPSEMLRPGRLGWEERILEREKARLESFPLQWTLPKEMLGLSIELSIQIDAALDVIGTTLSGVDNAKWAETLELAEYTVKKMDNLMERIEK